MNAVFLGCFSRVFVMKRYLSVLIGSGFCAVGVVLSPAYAANLLQVYQQAIKSDPIYAQAISTWHSQKMNFPIARAGYLPQLSLAANASRQYQNVSSTFSPSFFGPTRSGNTGSGYSWLYGYNVTASQQIFNYGAWEQIKNASYAVKAATATFLAAQQSLMQRTTTAYFNVLKAYDQLRYTVANKRAVWQQFVTAREQFRVGLIAITDEYDARASYDQVVAQQIAAQNNLNSQLENLRAITNHSYSALSGLGKLPLYAPLPNNINAWVHVANKQNYSVIAQNDTVLAAMENIKQQAAAAYPTVGLTGAIGEQHVTDMAPGSSQDTANLGLQLSYNPIQGGLVNAKTKQARYNYATSAGLLEQTHRAVVNQTRSSFLSILSDISRVKADRQTIMSTRNAEEATSAGLKVGTRTMVDVLNALTSLYQAQQQYANDQYSYINDLINLKLAAGTLSELDLQEINSWLGKAIRFPAQMSVATIPVDHAHDSVTVNKILGYSTPHSNNQNKSDNHVASTESAANVAAPTVEPMTAAPEQKTTVIPAPATERKYVPLPAPASVLKYS